MKIVELMKIKQEDNMNNRGVTIAFLGDSVTQGCFEFCKKNKDVYTVFDKNSAYHNYIAKIFSILDRSCKYYKCGNKWRYLQTWT